MAVYFIRNGDFIKIGKSVDPWKRLAALQTAHHETLEMLAVMPGSEDLEAGLHRAFGEYMRRGEWFEVNGRLLAFIEVVRTTFPEAQRNIAQDDPDAILLDEGAPDEQPISVTKASRPDVPLALGESTTFRMTHKGHFRTPSTEPYSFWQGLMLYSGGYWKRRQSEEWWVLNAPGMYFEFISMQHVTVTRQGDVQEGEVTVPFYTKRMSLHNALNEALKQGVYNRKNNGTWLGVYNDDQHGIVIAVKRVPDNHWVALAVPDEVVDYWRQYQYKSPLPLGVSIEA